MALNVTTAAIASGANTAIAQPSLAQWDQGQILKIEGVELPESYQVEFSGGGTVRTVPMIGTAEGVQIPNKLLQSSHPITAHIVLHEDVTDRETEYWITIYVKPRQAPETVEIDPADISIIDQTIAAAQQAVATSTAQAEAAAGSAEEAAASAEAAEASAQAAAGSASAAASSASAAAGSATAAASAQTAAETAQAAAEAAQAAAEQAVTDAQAAGSQAVEAIDEAKTAGIQAIDAEAATQINQVGLAGATQIQQINTLASNQMRSIENKTTQSIGAIEDARDAAIDDVQTEGQTQTAAAQAQAQAAAGSATAAANSASAAASSASAAATAKTGAETAAASVSASAAQIAQNAEDITNLNRQISELDTDLTDLTELVDTKAPAIYETASGDIASFTDGADGMPIKSLVANIEPVQDLHGYDYPWPGGGGKNKVLVKYPGRTSSGVTFTTNSDGTVSLSGTATAITYFTPNYRFETQYMTLLPAGTYTLSGTLSDNVRVYAVVWQTDGTSLGTITQDLGTGSTFTFDVPFWISPQIVVSSGANTNGLVVKFQVEEGSAKTAYAPYSNICPISGHTGASVTRMGKNLLAKPFVFRPVPSTLSDCFFIKAGTYAFSFESIGTATSWRVGVSLFDGDGNALSDARYIPNNNMNYLASVSMWYFGVDTALKSFVINIIEDCYTRIWFGSGNTDSSAVATNAQLELGFVATAYEPYQGSTLSITFPSSAGTVYGGTLDVTNGVLTVDRGMVDLGTLNWTKVASSNYKTFVGDLNTMRYLYNEKTVMSSAYVGTSGQDATASADNYVWVDSRNTIAIKDTSKADMSASEFKTAMSGVQLVYELATPVTYQLTPQELDTLLATNNIWADVGTVYVEYQADTKLYIEQLTKPTEDDMTANANIAANKFFMIGNTLYFSTAAIAAGATIIPGTNCNVVSLADALNNLNS